MILQIIIFLKITLRFVFKFISVCIVFYTNFGFQIVGHICELLFLVFRSGNKKKCLSENGLENYSKTFTPTNAFDMDFPYLDKGTSF